MSDAIAPWLVSAKVSPPRQLVNACRRNMLLKRLLGNNINPVTILEAPAGFGKTLLLSQWREELKSDSYTVAWLSIDESDEADILIPYIAFAFQKAELGMDETGLLSPSFHGIRTAYGLGRFLNRIENSGTRCVLMLDDVERCSDNVLSEVIEPLMRLQPDNLYLVLACRQNPGIPLSNLSVQGSLTLLGPQEMRFDKDEIGELFGQTLNKKEIEAISERTDGWPVAIQLLKSFVNDSHSLSNVLSTFLGSSKEAAGYFREQLLKSLSNEERGFLQETSILDPIHLECANYIRNATDSQTLVQQLRYLEGIFAPLEDDDETYRLHPLVREYLRGTLQDSDKETYKRLCRAAATWLAEKEQSLDAMRYALQADDVHLAGEIFEKMRGGPQLWLLEGMSRLRTGLDLLANYNIDEFPRIYLARSLVYAKDGQMKNARKSFDKASLLSDGFRRDREGGDDTKLLVDRYIMESLLTEYGCSPPTDALKADALNYIQDYVTDEVSLHGYFMTLQCLVNMQGGSFDECIRYGKAAIADFREFGSRYGELFIYIHFGMAELARCDTQQTLAQYEEATKMCRMEFPGDSGLRRICDVALGEVFWEIGDVNQARKYLKHVVNGVQHPEAWFDIYMAWYQTTSEYLLYDAGIDAAMMFLDKAKEHAQIQELARLEIFLNGISASLLHFADQTDTIMDYTSDIESFFSDPRVQITWREIEALSLAHSRLALRNKDYEIAATKIDYLLSTADKTGNTRLMIYGLIQNAIIESSRSNEKEADEAIIKAIELAKGGYYIRPFLQEVKSIYHLLESVQERKDMDRKGLEFISAVLDSSGNIGVIDQQSSVFSEREMEILFELSKGQPDKLIARSLSLTPHGVRYHLKNIYAKMGVRNRTQAIAKANDLGLIT
jgi:ATP/maltotriose-dependent transcriptional regulator MalT